MKYDLGFLYRAFMDMDMDMEWYYDREVRIWGGIEHMGGNRILAFVCVGWIALVEGNMTHISYCMEYLQGLDFWYVYCKVI